MQVEHYTCPSCGSEVEVGGQCPGCGPPPKEKVRHKKRRRKVAARKKSWEQDAVYDGLNLPGHDFDYDDFVEREFGKTPHRRMGIAWYWWVTALVLVGVLGWVFGRGL